MGKRKDPWERVATFDRLWTERKGWRINGPEGLEIIILALCRVALDINKRLKALEEKDDGE